MNTESLEARYIRLRTEHDKIELRVKNARLSKAQLRLDYQKTETHLKAIHSAGMYVGQILNA